MKLELDVYSVICETKKFVVNDIHASYKDFGDKYDIAPDQSKPNCCGNMVFLPKSSTPQILDKYGITAKEYRNICELLRSCVSFGTCRLCS